LESIEANFCASHITEAMARKLYTTDLTDQQWHILKPLIPTSKAGGRPRMVNIREVVNAIFYILAGGCAWRLLPQDKRHLGLQFTITFDVGALVVSGSR
jgi:hypothetical protein